MGAVHVYVYAFLYPAVFQGNTGITSSICLSVCPLCESEFVGISSESQNIFYQTLYVYAASLARVSCRKIGSLSSMSRSQ